MDKLNSDDSFFNDTHCPKCNFKLPWTTAWGAQDLTVCPKCNTTFEMGSKQIVSEHRKDLYASQV